MAAVWLEDDDKDERPVFFEELEEDLVDTQDLQSTRTLYQHSVEKTTLVSQNSLKMKTLIVVKDCSNFEVCG